MARAQPNGMLGNPNNPTESSRYTYGHGFGLLFLASVYGEEEDQDRRKKLELILKKAVEFTGKAQTDRGGWGYVSAKDGGNFDEGSTTITQLQAVRAARNAGHPGAEGDHRQVHEVPAGLHDAAGRDHLQPGERRVGGRRPGAAAADGRGRRLRVQQRPVQGRVRDQVDQVCKENIPIGKGRLSHDEYQSYYLSQAIYVLGDDRYGEMFPKEPKSGWWTWSGYKDAMFEYLKAQQNADGSWTSGYIGRCSRRPST